MHLTESFFILQLNSIKLQVFLPKLYTISSGTFVYFLTTVPLQSLQLLLPYNCFFPSTSLGCFSRTVSSAVFPKASSSPLMPPPGSQGISASSSDM